jgi:hypothetical protein
VGGGITGRGAGGATLSPAGPGAKVSALLCAVGCQAPVDSQGAWCCAAVCMHISKAASVHA